MPPSVASPARSEARTIGRFVLRRTLGKGAQGTVYLAHDPKLDREVAIKTLNRGHHDDARLLSEARNAARLSHPNVVPLYELGVHEQQPYLVYQYAAGQPLASVLAAEAPLAPHRALTMLGQLLDGIASAHSLGVLHRDLTPANVMVGADDSVRILDFGIACTMNQNDITAGIAGTVNYMAPEVLANQVPDARSDLFSLAAMLYEMLTGRRAFDADSPMAVAYKIVNEPVRPPSRLAPAVDPGLDEIVQQALNKDPGRRFDSAEAFKRALDDYVDRGAGAEDVKRGDSDAVNFLLRRINRKPDFPAISEHINEINRKAGSSNPNDAGDLAGVVLKDMGLTGKLLRLVNSAVYGQYGGQVTTVSRAVVILGFEQVRAAALSIILFEQVKNGQQADRLKDSACCSFLSAMIARNLAGDNDAINAEEAFISAMFNRIGRHLGIYFFPDECEEIDALAASRGIGEEAAAREILGTSFSELGLAIAKEWNLPEVFTASLSARPGRGKHTANEPAALTGQLAAFANEVAECIARSDSDADCDLRLKQIVDRYGGAFGRDVPVLKQHVETALDAARTYADVLHLDRGGSAVFERVLRRLDPADARAEHEPPDGGEAASAQAAPEEAAAAAATPDERRSVLTNSIVELTSTMLGEYQVGDIVAQVLEGFYRGMGFSKVLFLMRNPKQHSMQARVGLGARSDAIREQFAFKQGGGGDIFNEAARLGREFVIVDTDAERYRGKLPPWCLELAAPVSLVLFPLMVNDNCIGMVYADTEEAPASINAEELKLLHTLVKQAVLAIQQSQRRG